MAIAIAMATVMSMAIAIPHWIRISGIRNLEQSTRVSAHHFRGIALFLAWIVGLPLRVTVTLLLSPLPLHPPLSPATTVPSATTCGRKLGNQDSTVDETASKEDGFEWCGRNDPRLPMVTLCLRESATRGKMCVVYENTRNSGTNNTEGRATVEQAGKGERPGNKMSHQPEATTRRAGIYQCRHKLACCSKGWSRAKCEGG